MSHSGNGASGIFPVATGRSVPAMACKELHATLLLLVHLQPVTAMSEMALATDLGPSDMNGVRVQLVFGAGAAMLALLALLVTSVLSVYKPRGLTRQGQKSHRQATSTATRQQRRSTSPVVIGVPARDPFMVRRNANFTPLMWQPGLPRRRLPESSFPRIWQTIIRKLRNRGVRISEAAPSNHQPRLTVLMLPATIPAPP